MIITRKLKSGKISYMARAYDIKGKPYHKTFQSHREAQDWLNQEKMNKEAPHSEVRLNSGGNLYDRKRFKSPQAENLLLEMELSQHFEDAKKINEEREKNERLKEPIMDQALAEKKHVGEVAPKEKDIKNSSSKNTPNLKTVSEIEYEILRYVVDSGNMANNLIQAIFDRKIKGKFFPDKSQ